MGQKVNREQCRYKTRAKTPQIETVCGVFVYMGNEPIFGYARYFFMNLRRILDFCGGTGYNNYEKRCGHTYSGIRRIWMSWWISSPLPWAL